VSYLGVLSKRWEVTCAGCERSDVSGLRDKGAAMADFRNSGWGTRRGLWNCPACKDSPGAVNNRANIVNGHRP
jgi:hypothetical protein